MGLYEVSFRVSSREVLDHHLKKDHWTPSSNYHMQSILAVENPENRECPLCLKMSIGKERDFVSHLGKHMEAIALSALPKDSESESDGNQATDTDDVNVHPLNSSYVNMSQAQGFADQPEVSFATDEGYDDGYDGLRLIYEYNFDSEKKGSSIDSEVSDTEYDPRSTSTRKQYRLKTKSTSDKAKNECKHCNEPPFKNVLALSRHVASHYQAFTCVFAFTGCRSRFASANEWKRHVSYQHINLTAWYCELGSCGKASQSAKFNRKDLFTQHIRRLHAPDSVKRTRQLDLSWEEKIKNLQISCSRVNRHAPVQLRCPVTDCGVLFEGPNCWDEKMEHVGKHLERAARADSGILVDHGKDDLLVEWAVREGIIESKPAGGFKFAIPKQREKTDDENEEDDYDSQRHSQRQFSISRA